MIDIESVKTACGNLETVAEKFNASATAIRNIDYDAETLSIDDETLNDDISDLATAVEGYGEALKNKAENIRNTAYEIYQQQLSDNEADDTMDV